MLSRILCIYRKQHFLDKIIKFTRENNMNMTTEEKAKIKRKLSKLLNSIQKRTVLNDTTYETVNNLADDFTNLLYAKIDEIWERNVEEN
ncbi:hypothetical protein LCGT_1788 [Lactococcus garvieae ATCC 49156]|uniref:Uncharacterized protein n=3 Tax=Streptococcaceae TaxID=1300 RepID=F9VG18_LACGL|nr:hypothetical protein LCGT_1788 [Lactococcus garvieae ATCC 49156]BAK61269.1 hypothetical protein LCGL_1809 [Lactococcus garvieae Lg2]